jgi:hypothetical protein
MSIKIEHTSAGGIKFEPNQKLGYYQLGEHVYYNKVQALIAASCGPANTHRLNNDPVRWRFNDEAFLKFNWHEEPKVELRELYRMRAQQLRDTYDYLRLELSGGSDSTTVLYSFVLNNIPIDEVVFRYPKRGEKDVSADPWNTGSENTLSEWEYAARPLLNWISTHYPNIKITVYDYTDAMIADSDSRDESWIFKTRNYLQPGHGYKHATIALADHREQAERYTKVGVIYGVDKPKICLKDGKFWLYFIDQLACHNNNDVGDYTNITNELFYWTPDFPELVCKQAHVVKQWFSQPANNKFQNAVRWPNDNIRNRQMYEQLVRGIIYPDYDINTFQVAKPLLNFQCEMDTWFFTNFKDTRLYTTWQAGIDYVLNNLDSRYISSRNGQPYDMKTFLSTFYYLGDSDIEVNSPLDAGAVWNQARQDQTKIIHCIDRKLVIY